MASIEKYLNDDSNKQLIKLPEEIIREIFSYLSFETLYFTLRKVCKKMKCYVDHFIDVEGIFFLEGHRRGRIQHSEVIYIIQTKNKQFKVFWRPVSFVPWSPVYFKNDNAHGTHIEVTLILFLPLVWLSILLSGSI